METHFETWMITDSGLYRGELSAVFELAKEHEGDYQVLMLREKGITKQQRLEMLRSFRSLLGDKRIFLNWNGADQFEGWPIEGIHLGVSIWRDPHIQQKLWQLMKETDLKLSLAIHSLEEWEEALAMAYTPDYCILSPVLPSRCKEGAQTMGLEGAQAMAEIICLQCPETAIIIMGGIELNHREWIQKLPFSGVAIRSGWKK